jgi:hypothetical protein
MHPDHQPHSGKRFEMHRRELESWLAQLEERLVRGLVSQALGIREGAVMSLSGVMPYRRIDCDGKALCYVRRRPLKGAVRVDVSGLWAKPSASKLELADSSGLTLMVANYDDVKEAIEYLRSVVAATRRA